MPFPWTRVLFSLAIVLFVVPVHAKPVFDWGVEPSSFRIGDELVISGTVRDANAPWNGPLNLSFFSQAEFFSVDVHSVDDGFFSYVYHGTSLDPVSPWIVTVSTRGDPLAFASDSKTLQPRSTILPDTLEIAFPEGLAEVASRGSRVFVLVRFFQPDGEPLRQAVVTAGLESGPVTRLSETFPGEFSGDIEIPLDFVQGSQSLVFRVSRLVGAQQTRADFFYPIEITSAVIRLDVLEPSSRPYLRGQSVPIRIAARYADDARVNHPNFWARIGTQTIRLEPQDDGFLLGEWFVPVDFEPHERETIVLEGTDAFNNHVQFGTFVVISKDIDWLGGITNDPRMTLVILGIFLVGLIGLGAWVRRRHWRQSLIREKTRLEIERAHLNELFYVQKILSQEEFSKSQTEIETQLASIRQKLL